MKTKKLTPIQQSKRNWEEKMDRINFRMPKGKKEILLEYCNRHNTSINSLLNKLVDELLSKNN